jgi:GNAT superfamily N-acetyltransferase
MTWGRGIGSAFLQHATSRLKTLGFKDATLWVLDTNARTRRFYEAAGWQVEGSEKVEQMGGVALREARYRIDL